MASTLLLKNGTLLRHSGADDHVVPTKADLLISGNIIARIEPEIQASAAEQVMDCTDKIISPGFIDAHQHVWQTQLKGRHANHTFLEYMPSGNMQSSNYSREDIFWGQLGGCLSLLDAGTTTVVDHAHMNYFPEASPTAISATLTSGIRSFFCYAPAFRSVSWNPLAMGPSQVEEWVLSTFSSLAQRAPFGPTGRVQLGLAFDGWQLPAEAASAFFDAAQRAGVTLLTSHFVRGAMSQPFSLPALLRDRGLLSAERGFKVLLSHGAGATPEDAAMLRAAGAAVASTPGTELQMAVGRCLCFDELVADMACLGGDCHSNGGSSVVAEMRLGLQAVRGVRNQRILDRGLIPMKVHGSVGEAFNLGTINGARAVGLADRIGSLEVGKLADLVVFEATSPAMVCAAQHDPVAAVVLHSSPADISAVVVDGVVRKGGGKLVAVEVDDDAKDVAGKETLEWSDVAVELLKSRRKLQEKIETIDFAEALDVMTKTFHIDTSKIVDNV